uniref:signal recognition particle subunit SRP72-like n=1 Tax=Erigeron canadensis TaxID=72917 RepID=UPI001CB8CF6C|nr:signal recognition particle subunit SRP72-like [Erigeron canadensis]
MYFSDDEIDIKLAPVAVQGLCTAVFLLQLLGNKQGAIASYTDLINRNLPDESSNEIAINKLIALKGPKDISDGLKKLDRLIEKNNPEILLLARAQIAAAAGHPQVASESLLKIPDIQHMPATVATLASLKERARDINGASSRLDSAISYWSNAMTEESKLSVIMQEATAFKLKHGKKEEASQLYEKLVKIHNSIDALLRLIQTSANTDVETAVTYAKQLKPLPGLISVDVNALEKTSGAKHIKNGSHLANKIELYETKSKDRAKKKRKRKPRYPKRFDPAKPGPALDPERWIPSRERSSFRLKRKDKRVAQIR